MVPTKSEITTKAAIGATAALLTFVVFKIVKKSVHAQATGVPNCCKNGCNCVSNCLCSDRCECNCKETIAAVHDSSNCACCKYCHCGKDSKCGCTPLTRGLKCSSKQCHCADPVACGCGA